MTTCSDGDISLEAFVSDESHWDMIGSTIYFQCMETTIPNATDNQWSAIGEPVTNKKSTFNFTTEVSEFPFFFKNLALIWNRYFVTIAGFQKRHYPYENSLFKCWKTILSTYLSQITNLYCNTCSHNPKRESID
jgi:hypothetical protein